MEILDNINTIRDNDLKQTLQSGANLKIVAACFFEATPVVQELDISLEMLVCGKLPKGFLGDIFNER